jgi:glycosyltransferase involved in cell wall biosynthesis
MKIGWVAPGFAGDAADWCIPALTNHARALAALPEMDLHIYALRYPPRRDVYRLRGATVHAFGAAAVRGRRAPGVSLALLWGQFIAALREEQQRAPFDALHGFWATESGYLAALGGRALGIPTLVHLAGGELAYDRAARYGNQRPGFARLLVAGSLALAGALTVPSGLMEAQLRRRYPRHAGKALRWAFGVDTQVFTPAPSPPPAGPLRLIHVASLLPVKDQALLLEGLARARTEATPMRLTIAGSGPNRAALEARARRLGLADAVTFAGEVDHGALPALYRAHDAFVLTSRHEAQCMAALEAAACGLPWISPPVGATADLARRPPPSGWLVRRGDAPALAQALRAAADPRERAARGAAARRAVEVRYDLETQTRRLQDIYANLGATRDAGPLLSGPARRCGPRARRARGPKLPGRPPVFDEQADSQ